MPLRRRPHRLALLLVSLTAMVTGCTSTSRTGDTGPGPEQAVASFAAAWQSLRSDPIAALTTDPYSAAAQIAAVLKNLTPVKLSVAPGSIQQSDDQNATATAAFAWTLARGVSWKYTATWAFTRAGVGRAWKAAWSSSLINPRLGEEQTLALRTAPAADGTILDRDQQQILAPTTIYSVVALPGKMGNPAAAAAMLGKTLNPLDPTVTAGSVLAGLAAATPSTGYTVTNLRQNEYDRVRTALSAMPGVIVPTSTRNLPATKDFARELLSEVEPVAKKLMAGTPGWEIDAVDASGAELETLASQPARPGPNVTLTLDSAVQRAAETSLVGIQLPAMLVAIQPSTGDILAVAQNQQADAQGPLALTGQYPPGSTFKIVTATAGMESGAVTPTGLVNCPGVFTVNSRDIHNLGSFDLGYVSLTTAFARSCNTTFARLASTLPADALTRAAAQYGIGRDFVVPGITTLTGQVPPADGAVQKAENGFGQGVVLLTPFSAALMAATADNGSMPVPTLIRGTTTTFDQPVIPRPAAVDAGVRTLMRAVVTGGTGSVLSGDGEVYAKTGTADYIDDKGVDRAHAWTVAFRGDLAFSIFIVAGNSSHVTSEIAHTFLTAVKGY